MPEPSARRYEILFTGRVQGVGFRATTKHIANQFAVTGWVRNEPDGSVRLVAEGERAELDRFLAEISMKLGRNIINAARDDQPARGEFAHFEIRR